jgi:hypothetical protein
VRKDAVEDEMDEATVYYTIIHVQSSENRKKEEEWKNGSQC